MITMASRSPIRIAGSKMTTRPRPWHGSKAENQVTFDYLQKIPYRSKLKQRLEELYNYPKYGIPSRTGAYYLWSKNDGLQNQSVLYVQKGLEGTPRVPD